MATITMLTTIDNPFNPLEDFASWFLYDNQKGYGTCDYLGRITKTSEQLSDDENYEEIERAIDEIIEHDALNMYVKVKK